MIGGVRVRAWIAAVLLAVTGGCGDRIPAHGTTTGWTVTVYYTAVEKYHSGSSTVVTGCPRLDCQHGKDTLGAYPKDFVQAVHW